MTQAVAAHIAGRRADRPRGGDEKMRKILASTLAALEGVGRRHGALDRDPNRLERSVDRKAMNNIAKCAFRHNQSTIAVDVNDAPLFTARLCSSRRFGRSPQGR